MTKFNPYASRNKWSEDILAYMAPRLVPLGIRMPAGAWVRVCHQVALPDGRAGKFTHARHGANIIEVSPKVKAADDIVLTLLHGYLHACDGGASGHGMLGLQAASWSRSAWCQQLICQALQHIGPPPPPDSAVAHRQREDERRMRSELSYRRQFRWTHNFA